MRQIVGLLVLVALVPVFGACGSATSPRRAAKVVGWGRIVAANVDGSGIRELTHPPHRAVNEWPAFSPDGTAVAFVRRSRAGVARVYVMNPDGSNVRRVGSGQFPVWSPDSRWLAASTSTDRLYVMKADGSSVRQIGRGLDPVWSPDGRWLAYERWLPAAAQHQGLYVMKADGSSVRLIGSHGVAPVWSPDGKWLAYARWLKGNTDAAMLYVVRLDGTKWLRFPYGLAFGPDYAWSPDSRTLAYADGGLRLVDVMSGETRQLVRNRTLGKDVNAGGGLDPSGGGTSWSPQGDRIAFQAIGMENGTRIYVVALDGSPPRLLRPRLNDDPDPGVRTQMWSPDGKRLAYTADKGQATDVVVVNPASGRLVWRDHSPSRDPYWSPDGKEIVFVRGNAVFFSKR